jgi:hypothetical protein
MNINPGWVKKTIKQPRFFLAHQHLPDLFVELPRAILLALIGVENRKQL